VVGSTPACALGVGRRKADGQVAVNIAEEALLETSSASAGSSGSANTSPAWTAAIKEKYGQLVYTSLNARLGL